MKFIKRLLVSIKNYANEMRMQSSERIKSFKNNTIENLGYLIPVGISVISIIAGAIAIAKFIISGELLTQFSLGFFNGITSGTINLITEGIVANTVYILIDAEIVIMAIIFFKEASKSKKTIMCIALTVMAFCGAFYFVNFLIGIGLIDRDVVINILSPLSNMLGNIFYVAVLFMALFVISVITFTVLISKSSGKWMIRHTIKCLLYFYIGTVAVVALLENIIPIFSGILFIAIFAVIAFIVIKVFSGSLLSLGNSSSNFEKSTSNISSKEPKAKKVEAQNVQTPYQKRFDIGFETPLWVGDGGMGLGRAQADGIYYKDNVGSAGYICTVKDFEEGKVAIYINNKRRVDIPGCKMPKR